MKIIDGLVENGDIEHYEPFADADDYDDKPYTSSNGLILFL